MALNVYGYDNEDKNLISLEDQMAMRRDKIIDMLTPNSIISIGEITQKGVQKTLGDISEAVITFSKGNADNVVKLCSWVINTANSNTGEIVKIGHSFIVTGDNTIKITNTYLQNQSRLLQTIVTFKNNDQVLWIYG